MSENKHTASDLKQMQSLPLEAKIRMTQYRIREWYDNFGGQVYCSWSGGKDSTVLKHIIDSMYSDVPAVFVNTGLEYPEIQSFVRDVKKGKYECFSSNVEMLRPQIRFDEVIKKYGYPVISKVVADAVNQEKNSIAKGNYETVRVKQLMGTHMTADGTKKSQYDKSKYRFLLDAPFKVSDRCCYVMKKSPTKKYENRTGRKPFLGQMAVESKKRFDSWMKTGCNAFESNRQQSNPIAFWTEQDVLEYIVKYKVPYASVYGQIQEDGQLEGQMYIDGFHEKLCTTGVDRTGCMFCMFGCHLEKEPNRFQRMKHTHPNQYSYCMKPVEEGGLGLKEVLEYIGVKYE